MGMTGGWQIALVMDLLVLGLGRGCVAGKPVRGLNRRLGEPLGTSPISYTAVLLWLLSHPSTSCWSSQPLTACRAARSACNHTIPPPG